MSGRPGSAERTRECRRRRKERGPYWKKLPAPYQVGKDEFQFKDIIKDANGWIDAKIYYPFPYDLVSADIGAKKTLTAWWTGSQWDGLRLKIDHKIHYWKIYEEPQERQCEEE